jgi:hypothetical protein
MTGSTERAMTAERRVAKLEAALTPTQRVLAWVDEAHASGGLSEYVDSLLDQPADVFPANRLAREAAEAARAGRRGRTADVDTEVLRAVRGTHFRFQLVLRINVVAHDMIERETLVYAALIGQLAALASEGRKERLTDAQRRRLLETLRGFTASRVSQLAAAQDARSIAETRYLAGRAVSLHPTMPRAGRSCCTRRSSWRSWPIASPSSTACRRRLRTTKHRLTRKPWSRIWSNPPASKHTSSSTRATVPSRSRRPG